MCTFEVLPLRVDIVFLSSSIVAWLLSKFHIAYIVLISHHMDLVCERCSWYGFPLICTCIYLVGTVCFKLFESLLCMICCIVEATKNLFVSFVLNYYLLLHAYVYCCIDDYVVTCYLPP